MCNDCTEEREEIKINKTTQLTLSCTSPFYLTKKKKRCAAKLNHSINHIVHCSLMSAPPPSPHFCLTGPLPACCRAGVQVSSTAGRRPWGCTHSTVFPGPQTSVRFSHFHHNCFQSFWFNPGFELCVSVTQSSVWKCAWGVCQQDRGFSQC